MKRLPDFVIIGAMKCATSTLHEQLARQPGIFMSTPKEPSFFSNDEQWARGIDWYTSLFADAPPGALCGESSTHYTKLPTYPQTIDRMKQHLAPDAKFIYIMRHPIDRLISQYIHEWTQRVISCPIDQAIDRHPELIQYSRYAMQLSLFFDAFGRTRVFPMFFERLTKEPQSELQRACRFIGYERVPAWDDAIGEQNVSTERLRQSPLRDAIINLPGLRTVRQKLIPQSLRDRIKEFWSMRRRPELSAINLKRLEDLFDQDLSKLGEWLGLDLNCRSFNRIALQAIPQWRSAARAVVA